MQITMYRLGEFGRAILIATNGRKLTISDDTRTLNISFQIGEDAEDFLKHFAKEPITLRPETTENNITITVGSPSALLAMHIWCFDNNVICTRSY